MFKFGESLTLAEAKSYLMQVSIELGRLRQAQTRWQSSSPARQQQIEALSRELTNWILPNHRGAEKLNLPFKFYPQFYLWLINSCILSVTRLLSYAFHTGEYSSVGPCPSNCCDGVLDLV
jgi:hypothetical protein